MRYYLIDDEIGIVKTLENIIEAKDLGEVVGYATDPVKAGEEIVSTRPDIVIVDLLMSNLDGITLVREVKKVRPEIGFVMLSKVSDKGMIEQAYSAGVEFFINKPINLIEVEKVLRNVADKLKMNSIMSNIRGMFEEDASPREEDRTEALMQEIHLFLGLLGMTGEKGTADIMEVCRYLETRGGSYTKEVLLQVAEAKGDSSRNVEQRIRRAIKKGLTNVANRGIDDYSSEVFQVHANYVFEFRDIKDEMDYIKGLASTGGRVNISKFIEGLVLYAKGLK